MLQVGAAAQSGPNHEASGDLKLAIYVSRHGVRSPTGKAAQYNVYSAAPWPTWDVPPGHLTPHGFKLMELFGAFDRLQLASEGLIHPTGCEDASKITFYADSDQRTQETGKALAKGMLPGCDVNLHFLPEGTNDPLFHFLPSETGAAASGQGAALATAALLGRIGGSPANPTAAYRMQIAAMDQLLATCGATTPRDGKRISLLDIPATLADGSGDHLTDYKGPLTIASTLSENLLLEYTEGMEAGKVGWGCADGARVRSLIDLHTAATDYTQRTRAIARAQASNLLDHIGRALTQAVSGKQVPGAVARLGDSALFLIGHDTNLENLAGMLNLNWIEDGRRDDTPPGSALIFELWKDRKSGNYSVRTYFTAQTLEQMREASTLTLATPPERVQVFLPGCSGADGACPWDKFAMMLRDVVDPNNVAAK
jgi:4-phytase/acid phosphatase